MDQEVSTPVSEQAYWDISALLSRNRSWADAKKSRDPSFFHRLSEQQKPRYFWIGCSDSRVPATEIVDLDPGEMFVHRNVANLAVASDPNFAAALHFAIDVLRVQHVIVAGHYGCGGIHAAMTHEMDDPIDGWLSPIKKLQGSFKRESTAFSDDANALCEQNVIAQVEALAANPIVRTAWSRGQLLAIHGWVYAIENGLLKELYGPIIAPSPDDDAIGRY